ncbi:unnamed protein product [Brassica oleracea var. botrytis]
MEEVTTHIRAGINLPPRTRKHISRLERHPKQTETVMKQPAFVSKRTQADKFTDPTKHPQDKGEVAIRTGLCSLLP